MATKTKPNDGVTTDTATIEPEKYVNIKYEKYFFMFHFNTNYLKRACDQLTEGIRELLIDLI